jgi:hypothetical protein
MRIKEGEMKRIQALQQFIVDNTVKGMMTEAIAELIKGKAEMFRNSHIRVDATNLPDVHVYRDVSPANNNIILQNAVNVVH